MADGPNDVIDLKRTHVRDAAEMLGRAFQDDPQLSFIIPDAKRRKEALPHIFRFLLLDGISEGVVHATSERLEGVAAWFPSWKGGRSLWVLYRLGLLALYFRVGREVIKKLRFFSEFESSIRRRVAPYPHWYLSPLGVDPRFQGGGHAGKLMDAMLTRVDSENLPCCLETQNKKNIAFYRKYDFTVVDESTVPGTGVKTWVLVRKKQGI